MLLKAAYTFLTAALGATAVGVKNGNKDIKRADNFLVKKVLIGGGPSGIVAVANFDGTSFKIVANNTIAGTSPSWLLFKEPNLLYAVDENSTNTRLFNVSR